MDRKHHILACMLIALCASCSRPEGKVVARVYDTPLRVEDIQWMQADYDKDPERMEIRPEVVEAWIEKQVLVHAARTTLKKEEMRFDKELEAYRETLLADAYERKEVERRLDKNVTDEEIMQYYQEHKEDFEMHKTIVRINYAKFPLSFTRTETVRELLAKGSGRSMAEQERLEKICYEEAQNMYLESNWLVFDDILKEIPIHATDWQQYLQQHRMVEVTDSSSRYLVCFSDYKINETYSPLENERENIRNLLLDRRRMELRKQVRKDAMEKARKEHEIYNVIQH